MYNYNQLIKVLIDMEAVKATLYNSPKEIVRVVRKTYHGKILKGNVEIILTIGKPNFIEREFIKLCKQAGERFPIKKVQLKFLKGRKSK